MNWFRKTEKVEVLPPLEGYERWASTYSMEDNPVKKTSDERVKKFLPPLTGKNFLDAGCGPGSFCRYALLEGASHVVGIDLSPAMIAIAAKTCPGAEFRCSDLSSMVLEQNHYDVILSALVLGHVENLAHVLGRLIPALRTGGHLLITDFHPFLTLQHAKRTFHDPTLKKTMEIRHHLHLLEDYLRIFRDYNLRLELMEEPMWNDVPVIFIMRVQR
jgi:malonyl-CoA O-methyltransferase